MSTHERMRNPSVPSIAQLLLAVTEKYHAIRSASQEALYEELDPDKHKALVREATQLIADLPQLLHQYQSKGGDIPEEVAHECTILADIAAEHLQEDSLGGMLGFLMPRGARVDDPNYLEQLISRL